MPRFPGTGVPGVEERLHRESVLEFREHASQESREGSLLSPVSDPADRCQRGNATAKDCKGNARRALCRDLLSWRARTTLLSSPGEFQLSGFSGRRWCPRGTGTPARCARCPRPKMVHPCTPPSGPGCEPPQGPVSLLRERPEHDLAWRSRGKVEGRKTEVNSGKQNCPLS
jgi:hypothetical protein